MKRKAALVGFSLVVLFVAGEIAGRLLEQYADYRPRRRAAHVVPNPFLRMALKPDSRFDFGPFRIDINSHGFRGDADERNSKTQRRVHELLQRGSGQRGGQHQDGDKDECDTAHSAKR